jgi:hypothetical protein
MSQVQITMPPVLQSGGNYDLKWNAQTDEEARLHLPGKGIPAVHVSRLAVPPTCIKTPNSTSMLSSRLCFSSLSSPES